MLAWKLLHRSPSLFLPRYLSKISYLGLKIEENRKDANPVGGPLAIFF